VILQFLKEKERRHFLSVQIINYIRWKIVTPVTALVLWCNKRIIYKVK